MLVGFSLNVLASWSWSWLCSSGWDLRFVLLCPDSFSSAGAGEGASQDWWSVHCSAPPAATGKVKPGIILINLLGFGWLLFGFLGFFFNYYFYFRLLQRRWFLGNTGANLPGSKAAESDFSALGLGCASTAVTLDIDAVALDADAVALDWCRGSGHWCSESGHWCSGIGQWCSGTGLMQWYWTDAMTLNTDAVALDTDAVALDTDVLPRHTRQRISGRAQAAKGITGVQYSLLGAICRSHGEMERFTS